LYFGVRRARGGYVDGRDSQRGIASWIAFYNEQRPHQALTDRAPMTVWREAIAGDGAVDMMDNALALPTATSTPSATRSSRWSPIIRSIRSATAGS
jgi:putative transposase